MPGQEKEIGKITKLFKITQSGDQSFWISGPGFLSGHLTTTRFFAEELQGQLTQAFFLGLKFGKTIGSPFKASPASYSYKVEAFDLCIPFSGMEGAEIWARIFNEVFEAGSKSVH